MLLCSCLKYFDQFVYFLVFALITDFIRLLLAFFKMPLKIVYRSNNFFIAFSLEDPEGYKFPPLNLVFRVDNDTSIQLKSPNSEDYVPYPVIWSPVMTPASVPDPLTFVATEHNFDLGTNRVILVSPNPHFAVNTFSELVRLSLPRPSMPPPLPQPQFAAPPESQFGPNLRALLAQSPSTVVRTWSAAANAAPGESARAHSSRAEAVRPKLEPRQEDDRMNDDTEWCVHLPLTYTLFEY